MEAMTRGRTPYPDVLTPREWEVLALLREGLTNEQIARRLGITERGAKYHVSEILSKLGLDSRKEAATWQRSRKNLLAVSLGGAVVRAGMVMPCLAWLLLGVSAVAFLALAVGLAVMERREMPAQGSESSAERTSEEVVQLAREAEAVAQNSAPGGLLYQVFYAGGGGLYTFVFAEAGVRRDIVVIGPNSDPGTVRWEMSRVDNPDRESSPIRADLGSLQKSPEEVLEAMASITGAPFVSVVVGLSVNPKNSELVWSASAPVPGGQASSGSIGPKALRCEVPDMASISTMMRDQ